MRFPEFKEKVALVTGGAGGMGQAICVGFAREGADVAIVDINRENIDKVAAMVRDLGRKAIGLTVDVAGFKDVNDCVQKVYEEFKHIDILVNGAGFGLYAPFNEMTEEQWDTIIASHLKGTFNVTRAVINGMIAQKYGKIVGISSVTALTGTPKHANYAAAKAGIIGMSKALAREVARHGINVNCIAPSATDTPYMEALKKAPDVLEKALKTTPLGRMGTPEEIGALVLFLCSDGAAYITGQVISPNGGYYM